MPALTDDQQEALRAHARARRADEVRASQWAAWICLVAVALLVCALWWLL